MERIRVIQSILGHALFFGGVYGALGNFATEATLVYTEYPTLKNDPHFLNLPYTTLDASLAAAVYLLYLPHFRWQIVQDMYRDTKTNWRMSFQTFGFLSFLYPAMIETLKFCTVLMSDPIPVQRVLVRVCVTACITAILESFNIFQQIRGEMLQNVLHE